MATTSSELNSRQRVLNLFNKKPIDYIPVFSGQGNVTIHGLEKYGWNFAEIHTDAYKMAKAAASTYELFGFECAVVPFDMGVEAEVLGSKVNYYSHRTDIVYPTIVEHAAEKVVDLNLQIPTNIANSGRIPLVIEAIKILKKDIGDEVAIGSWVLGPYTLMGQLVDLSDLSKSVFKKRQLIIELLGIITEYLIKIIGIYRAAGADYVSVREMGAGPDILSPNVFAEVIMPNLRNIFASIDSPKILHICGDTNSIIEQMATAGAEAISVEKKNNVAVTRKIIGRDTLLFGDIDPYGVLVEGKTTDVDRAVKEAIDAGVDAIWPGCDLWPAVPKENMATLLSSARKYGRIG